MKKLIITLLFLLNLFSIKAQASYNMYFEGIWFPDSKENTTAVIMMFDFGKDKVSTVQNIDFKLHTSNNEKVIIENYDKITTTYIDNIEKVLVTSRYVLINSDKMKVTVLGKTIIYSKKKLTHKQIKN
tara:strand:+ start:37 stop:420 length:384 start_codon:yes stop_codon:yes gene_type:complete